MRKILLLCSVVAGCLAPAGTASELKPETVAAFDTYIRVTEARMNGELRNDDFLAIDRLSDARRGSVYDRLHHGDVYIEPLRTLDDGRPVSVPGGLIHHWIGVAFIPGATLSQTVRVLQDYNNHKVIYRPDIRDSKLLQKNGNDLRVYLQFYRKSIVTVVLDAEFDIRDMQLGNGRWQSVSHSTRIAEVEDVGTPSEREDPVGNDHGYLWRLNSYWRLEQKDGGVYVQNESVAMTRTIPMIIAWLINPMVKSIPRSSLSRLLLGTRDAVLKTKESSAVN